MPVDSTGVGNVGVLPHKDGGHPDTLSPQGPDLVRRVLYTYLTVIVPAEGDLAGREDLVAVIGAGIRQQDQQVLVCRGGVQQLRCHPQRQSVPVPAGGEVVKNLPFSVFLTEILQHPQHRIAPETAKAADADGDAAVRKAFRQNIPLGGDSLLTVKPGGRAVQQQVHRKAGGAFLVAAQKHLIVSQHWQPPDPPAVQMALSGGDGVRLLVDQHTVADLLRQPQEGALIEVAVFDVSGPVSLDLLLCLLKKPLGIGADRFVGRRLPTGEPEVAAQMVSGAVPLLHQCQFFGSVQTAAEAAFHIVPILGFPLIGT